MNIAERLERSAASQGERPAVIGGGRVLTFRELDAECARLAAGLAAVGIGPGVRAALMVPPGPEFVALAFALFRVGAVPVLIDPGIGRHALAKCLAEAAPAAFIGSPKAQLARALEGWAKGSLRVLVTVGPRWFWGGLTLDEVRRRGGPALAAHAAADDAAAAILFTSGSTGVPKGAVYTQATLEAQTELLGSHFGVRAGEVAVPTFPLFALFDVALGLTAVIPRMDATRPARVDPREIVGPIQKYGAAQLFGSPALLDAVGRWGERHGIALPSLKRVLSAGAPVPAQTLARFAKMLPPEARIHTPYGATEALPVASIDSGEVLGETAALSARGGGTCVGRALPGVEISLIRVSDGPIAAWSPDLLVPDGEVGEIVVRGPVVTREYFGRPDLTALAKIPGRLPTDLGGGASAPDGAVGDGIRHRMGDLGRRDAQGRLWFYGRKSQRVSTPEGTLYTIPCEAVFNAHPKVRRTALVGVGPVPVLCVELETAADQAAVEKELRVLGASFPHTASIRRFLFHPGFPVDIRHNAKIFREKLAVWAAGRLS